MKQDKLKIMGFVTHDNPGGAQKAMAKLQMNMPLDSVEMEIVYLYGRKGKSMTNGTVLVRSDTSIMFRYFLVAYRLFRSMSVKSPDAIISFLPLSFFNRSISL